MITKVIESARNTENTEMIENNLSAAPHCPSSSSPQGGDGLDGVADAFPPGREGFENVIDADEQSITSRDPRLHGDDSERMNERNNPKPTREDIEKDNKIKNILSKMEHYKKGDPVDLYLRSRGITKHSPDTYIVNTDKMAIMVNTCYKTVSNTKKEQEETGNLYHKTESIAGIQEIFLTRDGKKRENSNFPSKIQRSYFNNTISGNPVRLSEKGDNNGYIYVTEGVENGLSIQEVVNNEVWCALSIVNIPTLPFENNKVYIFVFDNDYNKTKQTKSSENLKENLKKLDVNYKIEGDDIVYNLGEYNLKSTLYKLKQLKNKHFFYLLPDKEGADANDLLGVDERVMTTRDPRFLSANFGYEVSHSSKLDGLPSDPRFHGDDISGDEKLITTRDSRFRGNNREHGNDSSRKDINTALHNLLLHTPLKEIETESIIKLNKKTKEAVYWRPQKQFGTNDNDNLTKDFIGIPYDNRGLAIRFLKRFGNNYKKVDGIGICKYDDGKYNQKQEDNLFADIQQTILMTYYKYDYLIDEELKKSFKKLWIDRGVGEYKTVSNVEDYVKRSQELNVDINEFDNENNNIINLANGYYDLDKDELVEHSKDKLFFRKLDTKYNKEIKADLEKYYVLNNDWNRYLLTTFCDKVNGSYTNDTKGLEKIRFLQKAIGYTFSTSVKEEKLFIVKGVTRSGKNTFLDTIQEVMKDYCGDSQDEEFITSKEQNNNYLLSIRASLKGKRFLHISEISKNKKLNGAQIKRLVGNRTITAKFMHQNSFSYKQQTKYWIATNNIDFNEFDESIKTKLFIIDFDKRFYEEGTKEALETGRVMDRDLKDRLLSPENKEFILKWIIEGYRLYKKEGLQQTEEMQEALDQIEADNDTMGMFVKDCMRQYNTDKEFVFGGQKDIHEVYRVYREYEITQYATPEENIIGLRKFIKNMRNRGFNIDRKYIKSISQQNYYIEGWCLNTETVKTIPTTGGTYEE